MEYPAKYRKAMSDKPCLKPISRYQGRPAPPDIDKLPKPSKNITRGLLYADMRGRLCGAVWGNKDWR